MIFNDPLGLVEISLPPGWTEYPGTTGLFRLAFVPWTDDAWITVEIYGHRSAMDSLNSEPHQTWLTRVAAAVEAPPDAHVVEWDIREGRAVFIHERGQRPGHGERDRPRPAALCPGCSVTGDPEFLPPGDPTRNDDAGYHDDHHSEAHIDAVVLIGVDYDVVARGQSRSEAGTPSIDQTRILHRALNRLCKTLKITARATVALREENSLYTDDWEIDFKETGASEEFTRKAEQCLQNVRVKFWEVARRDGSEAARGECGLRSLPVISYLTQMNADPLMAYSGELLARRTANSVRDGGLPETTERRIRLWVEHFRQLQVELMKGGFQDTGSSASMAALRQRWTFRNINSSSLATPARILMLKSTLSDSCLKVVEERVQQQQDQFHLSDALLLASAAAHILAVAVLRSMDVESALEADDLAIALAEEADAIRGGRDAFAKKALIAALLNAAGTLLEVGDQPALETMQARLDRSETELDALRDEGALRAWCAVLWLTILRRSDQTEKLEAAISRGLAAWDADPKSLPAHGSLLKQARLMLLIEQGAEIEPLLPEMQEIIMAQQSMDGERDQVLLADSLTRQAELLIHANRSDAALEIVVRAIEMLLKSAPFGSDMADAFRVAALALCDAPSSGDKGLLRLMAFQSAAGSLRVQQALFATDDNKIASSDADRALAVTQEYIAAALEFSPLYALEAVDAVRGAALVGLIPGNQVHVAEELESSLAHLPPVPSEEGADTTSRLNAATDWMAEAANRILTAANAPLPIGTAEFCDLAKQTESLLIMLQPVDDRLIYFLATPDGTPTIVIGDPVYREIEELSAALASELKINVAGRGTASTVSSEAPDRVEMNLERLSTLVLDPIMNLLRDPTPIIVSPYRDLWRVPFGLLTGPIGHLSEQHPFSVVPSFGSLLEIRKRVPWRRPLPTSAFVVGDPLLSNRARGLGLNQLPGARQEAINLERRLRGLGVDSTEARFGADATEEAYVRNAADTDLLHLACHAILDEPAPTSCLFLAAGSNWDGKLTAREIPDVPLRDALVVLSACQTAQGRPTAEGLIGLARSFLLAGARAVVASNWKVSDTVTQVLVSHLYDALFDPNSSHNLAFALQLAARNTRRDLAAGHVVNSNGAVLGDHISNWGPFVAIGDATSVSFGSHGAQ